MVTERFRDRARAAIAALDRYRAAALAGVEKRRGPIHRLAGHRRRRTVARGGHHRSSIAHPATERAYSCIVDQVGDGRIHVVPQIPGGDGWVRKPGIVTEEVVKNLENQGVIVPKLSWGTGRTIPKQAGRKERAPADPVGGM